VTCNGLQDAVLMQATALAIEREAYRRLPELLAELLGETDTRVDVEEPASSHSRSPGLLVSDARGRRWAVEVKSSSGPGRVADAARQLREYSRDDAVALLVVPHMSSSGARAAEEAELNWIDLSGNAHMRDGDLYVHVQGRPNRYRSPGRPSSPFAPKSARVARTLLIDPSRWWRQRDLVEATGLDDGSVSRTVRRLDDELLLEHRDREFRPRDPDLLLDAWAQDYRFDRHEIVPGHLSGSGIELARSLDEHLRSLNLHHAFTGLPAAWVIDQFASFRLSTVYVEGDPHDIAERVGMRTGQKGANIQLVAPDDIGVFTGERRQDELDCVAPVQVYLDLLHLPERADEAARHLRTHHLNQHAHSE
jgi:hypothetical protein